jgi:hypothetical protein
MRRRIVEADSSEAPAGSSGQDTMRSSGGGSKIRSRSRSPALLCLGLMVIISTGAPPHQRELVQLPPPAYFTAWPRGCCPGMLLPGCVSQQPRRQMLENRCQAARYIPATALVGLFHSWVSISARLCGNVSILHRLAAQRKSAVWAQEATCNTITSSWLDLTTLSMPRHWLCAPVLRSSSRSNHPVWAA